MVSGILAAMSAAERPSAAEQLARVHREWMAQEDDLWLFGYASLIWRREFETAETRPAQVRAWHRALRMRSRVNRGTPEQPGLVFALLPGGSCRGLAFRIDRELAHTELPRLWDREMPNGVYDARWLRCTTPAGEVRALGFTLARASSHHTGPIADTHLIDILRTARGRFGTTLDYLIQTAVALREHQVHDREVERMVALARRHGLA
jgi:cation transport protein ChaC